MKQYLQAGIAFFKKETVLCIAVILAVISAFIIWPDREYPGYIDFRTLAILFSLMAVMAGFQQIGVFSRIAGSLLGRVRSVRSLVMVLMLLCFLSSMLITNDVALITFVPFTFTVFGLMGTQLKDKLVIPVIVMETIAANLGSMLTPIGNPQNLYLYGQSGIALVDFVKLMLPYTVVSLVLLVIWVAVLGSPRLGAGQKLQFAGGISTGEAADGQTLDGKRLAVYLVLFVLCLLTVARVLPYGITLGVVILAVLLVDRKVLGKVDYGLLITFVGFFVFIGNMGRIPAFSNFLASMIQGREVFTAVVSSQVISNVPAALLLSGFTGEYEALIVGTNLGGLGTLIASMASLISFKYIGKEAGDRKGAYLGSFTVMNLLFLAVLLCYFYIA